MDGFSDWVFFSPPSPNHSNRELDIFQVSEQQVTFSHEPGFYGDEILLVLNVIDTAISIYYKIDGRKPELTSLEYKEGITLSFDNHPVEYLSHIPTAKGWRLPEGEVNQCHVIRAQGFRGNQRVGKEVKGSYFIEEKKEDRYEMPVISLITTPENLFDADSGIYHIGNNENYDQRGRSWERRSYFEYFENGELVLSQDLGIRITGGLSRIRPQKSLKFYPRDDYGKDCLDYPFFGKDYEGDFERLSVRALSNQWTPAAINEDFAHELSHRQQLNFEYQRRKFVVVFINGEYWGVHSFRETSDEEFISKRNGVKEEDVLIDGEEYSVFNAFVIDNDMSNDELYEEALAQMDINSLLDYFVVQIFIGNRDWPQNNIKRWKVKGEGGKWRWIFYDLDGGFQQDNYGHINFYFEPEELHVDKHFEAYKFMRSLLQNESFRDLFRAKVIHHVNETFYPSNSLPIYNELKAEIEPEIKEHIRRWNYPNSLRRWENATVNTKGFLLRRGDVLIQQVLERLGVPLEVYPNPVGNNLHGKIELGRKDNVQFYLFDLNGKQSFLDAHEMPEGLTTFNFDVSNYQSGVYLFTALTSQQIYYKKIVIEK